MNSKQPHMLLPPALRDAAQPGGTTMDKHLHAWTTCAEAMLMQDGESLIDAAKRAVSRSRRLNLYTRRTQIAYVISGGLRTNGDPWRNIHRAAELWQWGRQC